MTPIVLSALLGTLSGFVLAAVAVLWLHERREFRKQDQHEAAAVAREQRAVERHEAQMRELASAQRGYLSAVNQRSRLEQRVGALEAAANDHAGHLAALGRPAATKIRLPVILTRVDEGA